MNDWFFMLFCSQMQWTKGFISKWRKKELRVFKYNDIKVVALNDFKNRRVLVWYFYMPTKRIMRVAYHGYHTRYLANKIAFTVKLMQTDVDYRELRLFERRSFSFKADVKRKNLAKNG